MKDCIIVTSVVQTTDKPLSYSNTRSIYSHQQRFEQTLETINSIRKNMPGVHILLIECSPPSEWMDTLKAKVDQFINLEFNEIVNNSLHKGLGEKTMLLYALSNLTEEYANIYKITGRYVLVDNWYFNISNWTNTDELTFCKTHCYGIKDGIHTFFYRIPSSKLSLFKEVLNEYDGIGCIENFFTHKFENKITFIEIIGIEVRWACYDQIQYF
jgi:hypothetical protein